MNFPFKIVRRSSQPPAPQINRSPLKAGWNRDPKSGRLTQTWRSSDDGERSCTRRPSRPPALLRPDLPLAA
jgi:hypothetical protein